MKTIEAVRAYKIMKSSKLTKMEDADKMKFIKAMRVLRPISEEYDKDLEEGKKALQDDKFEEMQQKAAKHNEAIQNKTQDGLLSFSELKELNDYFTNYEKSARELVKELDEKEITITIGRLNEAAFGKLVASNDMTGEDLMALSDVILE